MESKELASHLDHTYLNTDCTEDDVKRVCNEAIEYGFRTVCIYPKFLPITVKMLKGKNPEPIAVIDFPKGDASVEDKALQAKEAVQMGAQEIDMVINYHALKKGHLEEVFEGIKAVVEASKPHSVKVILETCFLSHDEKVIACALSKVAGAAFVKTSTGFGKSGATVEDVMLMRHIVGRDMGVKASGGIHTRKEAMKMIDAGATRIGASKSIDILKGESQ